MRAGSVAAPQRSARREPRRARRAIELFIRRSPTGRCSWYPVLADDLVASAAKLQATPDEILGRSTGFVPAATRK